MKNNYHFIEPVLLTKLHIMKIGKLKLSQTLPTLQLIAIQYNLKLNRVSDFRVAVKIMEDCIIKN
jgi:hypothetical protein